MNDAIKLCIVGGGGFRTPHVWEALLHDPARRGLADAHPHGHRTVAEVVLFDTDPHRLAVMTRLLHQLAQGHPDAPRLTATSDLRAAVTGSDFVFAAIRVAGVDGRCRDEHVALDAGVLGQETTGPGGIAYAIRTVPVMLELARLIASHAPQAYLLNFTNPAGIITEATQRILGDRSIGICDTPAELGRAVAHTLGQDPAAVAMDYVGLNHLGWMRRVMVGERDLLPELLADDAALASMDQTRVFDRDWLRLTGTLPNEYLYYYYSNREAVAAIRGAAQTRGDFLARTQTAFYELAGQVGEGGDVAALWRRTGAEREANYMAEAKGVEQGRAATEAVEAGHQDGPASEHAYQEQGYAGVALRVMAAITRGEPATMILNVRNNGTVRSLPDDAVVEVPTLVDAGGVHPLTLPSQPSLGQSGLMQQIKAVERHAIAAATTGDPGEALQAFAGHPLVDSVAVARQLLDGYTAAIPEFAAVLRPR